MVAVAAGAALLVASGTGTGTGTGHRAESGRTTATFSEVTACCRTVPSPEQVAVRSIVALRSTEGSTTRWVSGVVVFPGDLVVAPYHELAGASAVSAMPDTGGFEPAQLVGADPGSDLAVLRVRSKLRVADFADDDPKGGNDVVVALTDANAAGRADAAWASSTVVSLGVPVPSASAGMGGIETVGPMAGMHGGVLVDQSGRVLGLFDLATGRGASKAVFLPAALVVGVARDLASQDAVHHGWLDVSAIDAPRAALPKAPIPGLDGRALPAPSGGAKVVRVANTGAASGVLNDGDVVVAVDGFPVRSVAELRTRIYTMTAGTPIDLEIYRDQGYARVAVTLAASP